MAVNEFRPTPTPNFSLVPGYVKHCEPGEFFTYYDLQAMWQLAPSSKSRHIDTTRRLQMLVDIGVLKDEGNECYTFVQPPDYKAYNVWKREACKPDHWWSKVPEKKYVE